MTHLLHDKIRDSVNSLCTQYLERIKELLQDIENCRYDSEDSYFRDSDGDWNNNVEIVEGN